MTAVRLRGTDAQKRSIEVHRMNVEEHMTVQEIAEHFEASQRAVWSWLQEGRRLAMPDIDDQEAWRQQLTGLINHHILEASETGEVKDLVSLVDRLAKLNGYDHSHRIELAKLQLDALRVKMLAERMATALDTAGVPVSQQVQVLELIASG